MSQKTLDTKTETEVVAYIARGDTYETIIKVLSERGIVITKGTISNVKTRNTEALEFMQKAMQTQELSRAQVILRKSRELLEKKLDRSSKIDDELLELDRAHATGEIEPNDYWRAKEAILKRELTASELNSITKESFNQSQVEQGKPSTITDNPTQAKANLSRLLTAIAQGDEKAAIDAIFLDA